MTLKSESIELQIKLAKKVITKNVLPSRIQKVCGVDVSYKDNIAYSSAVILKKDTLEIIEHANLSQKVSSSYIPGLFFLRESEPILHVLNKLEMDFDLLLVDGHGQLHPRKCGLACFIGIKIDKPVIGIAKNLLCGKIKPDNKIEFENKILGHQVIHNKKKIYVSIGNKLNLKTATRLAEELTSKGNWYPEPLRLADLYSKKFRQSKLKN